MKSAALCTVIQDTREPALTSGDTEAALFRPAVHRSGKRIELPVERRKLDAGDYSLPDLEHVVAFERKSVGDLIGTLVGSTTDSVGERAGNLERFRAELERLRAYPYARIIVEGSTSSLYRALEGRRVQPIAIMHLLASIDTDYRIPCIWAGNREGAELLVGYTLSRIWEQHVGGEAWKKAEQRGYAAEIPWGPPAELAKYQGVA